MPRPRPQRLAELATRVDIPAAQADPSARARYDVVEAFTGDVIGTVPVGTEQDVADAFVRARRAASAWQEVEVTRRAEVLTRFAALVHRHRAEILDIIQAETGKNRTSALDEVLDVILTARFYAAGAPKWLAPRRISGAIPMLTKTTVVHQPRGVVGMITPWNYPFSLSMGDGLAAVVAGNAVVHKPASLTPFSTLVGMELWREAGLPADVWQVVPGSGSQVGSAIVDRCDYLMFTGSSATGTELGAAVGRRLVPFSAELGGKNPMIVGAGADLERVAEIAVRACFASAGQLCMSIERIYVEASVHEEFCRVLTRRVAAMRLGAGYDWAPEMGSLVSTDQLAVVRDHIDDAVAKGARVLVGGRHRPDLGPMFHEPTLLVDVPPEAAVYAQETFGPVVSIYPVADLDEAVARANDSEYGLASAVFCATDEEGEAVAARLDTGMSNVNEGYAVAWSSLGGPSGGMGISGVGYRHGREGLLKYTQARTIAVQSRRMHLGGPAFLPRSAWASMLTATTDLMRFRRG